jgi:hypothetical protein
LRTIASLGNEIGGQTLSHARLSQMTTFQIRDEVCNDRKTLTMLGFRVVSFAYPYGETSPIIRGIVQDCGYNSARVSSGLYVDQASCKDCPRAEQVKQMDNWRIRTSDNNMKLGVLKARITAVMQSGGGYLPLVFDHVCECPDKGNGDTWMSPDDFAELVRWVSAQKGLKVLPVTAVVGGGIRPVYGQGLTRLTDPQPVSDKAHHAVVAFRVGSVGVGQGFVIAMGLSITLIIVFMFRIATRRHRYART